MANNTNDIETRLKNAESRVIKTEDGEVIVTPSIAIGTVTTGAAGTDASVTNSGDSDDVVLDFVIPRGDTGHAAATVNVGTVTTGEAGTDASVTNSGTTDDAVFDFVIPRGDTGAATVTIGTVTTGEAGTDASVTNSGTDEDVILDFTIPRGSDGASPETLLNFCYPIGSIYTSTNSTSPAELFGGTWTQIKDTFLLTAGDTYTAGDTGGAATVTPSGTVGGHTLTVSEIPSHSHKVGRVLTAASGSAMTVATAYSSGAQHSQVESYYTGGGGSHNHGLTMNSQNNMPPYKVVYAWERTA